MKQGIDVVLKAISFDEHIEDADLIITGEGKTDFQTFSGKTPFGIAKVAQKEKKPVILISGMIDEECGIESLSIFTEFHAIAGKRGVIRKVNFKCISLFTFENKENYGDYLRK